ncbi:hypothetical protein B0H13DRAFT_1855184 [Mycena leptocephala]|nr:hypothetical protein B0H13DRAFT_1855184 [Mycena leptocephala]
MPLASNGDDVWAAGNEAEEEDDDGTGAAGQKRKRYESSDDTMNAWHGQEQRFLDELLRGKGLHDASDNCPCCDKPFEQSARRFCCVHCGEFSQCHECILERHALFPLHRVQEWKGSYWVNVTLEGLGSVYQLGHGGHACAHPAPAIRTMVVMDTEHIHTLDHAGNLEQLLRNGWYPATTVDPATCATFASLELFRLLNVVGNINVHDFVGTLEQRTNATELKLVPDRYKSFGCMTRQYAFLKRMKRAGRGHDPMGVGNTKNGECAVMCWACPHDNINLPEGWRDVVPKWRFLYILLLAMDANFRLKSQLCVNEHADLPLGSGWGYLVEERPYKEHLKGYVAEKDVSTCITFAALMQKDTRLMTGLRCLGVGGVVCIREHGLNTAICGTGDNHAVSGNLWEINLPMWMVAMPEHMRLDSEKMTVLFGLPVWHAAAHEKKCQTQNSLTYMPGMGRTDGEGIERTWAHLNPLAWATKEMRVGARHDAMEDKIDHLNFEKNIHQETTLPRKLILAVDERDRQVTAFKEVDAIKKEVKQKWQKMIDDWRADKSKPNPYALADGGPTDVAIRLALAKDEAQDAATGGAKLQGSSVTSFLTAGLQLEDSQRRIRLEAKGRTLLVVDQSEKIAEMWFSFFSKLAKFRKLQAVYMPGAVRELEEEEDTLHAKCHLLNYHNTGVAEQRAATCAFTLIRRIGERVDVVAGKYRRAWLVFVASRGREMGMTFRELKPCDVQLDEEQEINARAQKKLGNIGSTKHRRQGPAMSSKERYLSWIWTEGGGLGENEKELHESVRVEWSKAKAQKERWEEEVELLREEMKHILRFLRWWALWWETRRGIWRESVGADIQGGLEVYAARQAVAARAIARRFRAAWDTSAATAVRVTAREDALLAESMAAFAEVSAEGVEADV